MSLEDVVPLTNESVVILRSRFRIVGSSRSSFPRLVGTNEMKDIDVLAVSFVSRSVAERGGRGRIGNCSVNVNNREFDERKGNKINSRVVGGRSYIVGEAETIPIWEKVVQ